VLRRRVQLKPLRRLSLIYNRLLQKISIGGAPCYLHRIRNGIEVRLDPDDLERLQAVVGDRHSLQKHIWRADIVVLTAESLGTNEIMRRSGKSKPCVRRWQERFMTDGVDGLLRDKTRLPGKAPIADTMVAGLSEISCVGHLLNIAIGRS
jgi:hypothetical protein